MTIATKQQRPHTSADTPPTMLHERAEADLAFVRDVMERSTRFTAVPGWGAIGMGATAVAAAIIAWQQPSHERWLAVWLGEAIVAATIGGVAMLRKARRTSLPTLAAPARRFAFGLVPPLIVGAALTVGCVQANAWALLAPVWLCCFGVAILGGAAVSSAPVLRVLGAAFVVVGVVAVATPERWSDVWMALAFGGGHLATGVVVVRQHGG